MGRKSEYQAAAFRVAYLLVGSAADAEDAAEETFVKAYLALGCRALTRCFGPIAALSWPERGNTRHPWPRLPPYAAAISAGTPGSPRNPNGSPASRTRATIAAVTDGSIAGS